MKKILTSYFLYFFINSIFCNVSIANPECFGRYAWLKKKYADLAQTTLSFRNGLRIYTAQSTKTIDAKSFSIFDKIRHNPVENINSLPEDEIQHLKAQNLEQLFQQYNHASQVIKNMNHSLAILYRSQPAAVEHSYLGAALEKVKILLLPFLPNLHDLKIQKIYIKFLNDPKFTLEKLSKHELAYIEKKGLRKDLERYIEDLNSYRSQFLTLTSIRQNRNRIIWTMIPAVSLTGAAFSQIEHKDITLSQSFNEDDPDGIKRIGWDTEIIFSEDKYFPILLKSGGNFWAFQDKEGAISLGSVSRSIGWQPITVDALAKNPSFSKATHIRVGLNLNKEEIQNIRKELDLEIEETKRNPYINIDWQRSSVLRLSEFLKKNIGLHIPYGFNKNADAMLFYLKANKLLNTNQADPRIGEIRMAHEKIPTKPERALNLAGDFLENYFFMNMLPLIAASGTLMDQLVQDRAILSKKNK